jgi:hypothetical protein
VVVGCGEAGCVADRAVDVGDCAARPAHEMVVIVADPALEPGRAAGRLDAANEASRGERVQCLVYGLQGDVAQAGAYPGGERLDPEMVTIPDGFEQGDPGRRHPQAGLAQLIGGRRKLRCGHVANLSG